MPEVMARVGTIGNYLGERETRRRVRSGEVFFPAISDRRSYEHWEAAGSDELDVASARLDVLLAEGRHRDRSSTMRKCVNSRPASTTWSRTARRVTEAQR